MAYSNLQVRVFSDLKKAKRRLSKKFSYSEYIRIAIMEKIWCDETKKMEDQWIEALKKYPPTKEEIDEARDWSRAQSWGEL